MMRTTKENPKAFAIAVFQVINRKPMLVLPLLGALMVAVGRSIYQSNAIGGAYSPNVHRLAAVAPKTLHPTRRLGRNKAFQPKKGDVHIDTRALSTSNHRKLVTSEAPSCKRPTLTCDHIFAVPRSPPKLYKINILTGDEEYIGQGEIQGLQGLTYDPISVQLFASSRKSGGSLVKIDPCDGKATLLGKQGFMIYDLAMDSRGNLYGLSADEQAVEFVLSALNKTTGKATVIGPTGIPMDTTITDTSAKGYNMAFDGDDVLHMVDANSKHYIISTAFGNAALQGTIGGIDARKGSYQYGDIQTGSSLFYSASQVDGLGFHVFDLAGAVDPYTVPTNNRYYVSTFACKKAHNEYRFGIKTTNTTADYSLENPKRINVNVVPPGPDDPPIERNPPPPGHVAKPPSGGENVEREEEESLRNVDTGDAIVRYETPGNTDYSIPFVFVMEVNVTLAGPGPETRISLHVYRHPENPAEGPIQIVNSSPIVGLKGVIFFVPLQAGNFTAQLLDPSGVPIAESTNLQNATFDVKTFPYSAGGEVESNF